jgi:hypothetical protein
MIYEINLTHTDYLYEENIVSFEEYFDILELHSEAERLLNEE